jgi:hypothetical protein
MVVKNRPVIFTTYEAILNVWKDIGGCGMTFFDEMFIEDKIISFRYTF